MDSGKEENTILSDREHFRKFVKHHPLTVLEILQYAMRKPDLRYADDKNMIGTMRIDDEEVPYVKLQSEGKDIEALVGFVDCDPEERRAGFYDRALNRDIYRRMGFNDSSSEEEVSKVPDSYVVFFAKNDPYGKGKATYLAVNCMYGSNRG